MKWLREECADALLRGDRPHDLPLAPAHRERRKPGLGSTAEGAVGGHETLDELLEPAAVHDRVAQLYAHGVGGAPYDADLHEGTAARVDGRDHELLERPRGIFGRNKAADIQRLAVLTQPPVRIEEPRDEPAVHDRVGLPHDAECLDKTGIVDPPVGFENESHSPVMPDADDDREPVLDRGWESCADTPSHANTPYASDFL